ncbi:hypothetical protein [Grimontia hollisae]|uniref:hypothetical protein n=1 Tax=Grimontia hollisae TaxID=673 RepID=UPI001303A80C|nr:hypothetical protein [Grimontia hollisae]
MKIVITASGGKVLTSLHANGHLSAMTGFIFLNARMQCTSTTGGSYCALMKG